MFFGVDFMLGGMSLVILRLAFVLFLAYLFFNPVATVLKNCLKETDKIFVFTKLDKFKMILGFVLIAIFNLAPNQPLRKIDLPANQHQLEYNRPKTLEMKTPESRTEKLEGFSPLKKD